MNLCNDVCMYNCLFGWMDIRGNVCMSLASLVDRWMLIGFLLAKMCCFFVKRL